MYPTDKESKLIISLVLIGEIIILNALFVLLSTLLDNIVFENITQQLVLLSLCYVVSVAMLGGVILHRRRVRTEQIIRIVLQNFAIFFAIWIATVSVCKLDTLSIEEYILLGILDVIAVCVYRLTFHSILKGMRRRSSNKCKVIFVGNSNNLYELYEDMQQDPSTGYSVLGYFADEENADFKIPYLGTSTDVTDYIAKNNIQRLYCALPSAFKDTILSIITECESNMVRFYSVPNLRNYLQRRVTLEMFSNIPTLSIRPEPLSKLDNRIIKRIFDLCVSSIFLVTVFPIVLLLFGTLIKISSKGPVFFKQERNGLDGKKFYCYKFRSMRVNVNSDKLQATKDDPRKTKIGDFMRKTSVDELPQFVNVFKGDMSIVGPRPHMVKHTEEYSKLIKTYMVRHLVKPGITGMAQVTGFRGETKELSEMEGRVKADIWYMEHWTFMLDLYIMYKTVANVVTNNDKNAF